MFNNQRVVITPSTGIGTLRKNLIETIGYERTKTFLIRYGWNLGVSDAVLKIQENQGASITDIIMEGPKQHMLMGHAIIEGEIIKLNPKKNHFHMEGTWLHSYEAFEHIRLFGISRESVCHILVGYASGYTSEVLGTTVIFKEETCEGMGKGPCRWVGKTLTDWQGKIDQELSYFKENNLINELENAYEQIVVERDNLNQTFIFHKNLMEQIMLGKDLQSIASMVHEFLGVPILISSQNNRALAAVGLTESDIDSCQSELTKWFKDRNNVDMDKKLRNRRDLDNPHILTKLISITEDQHYLISPIIVRQKVAGYCSLILKCQEIKDINRMILERTASASSIFLLSQQIAIETEQRSRGYFLEQILSKQLSKEEILKWGHYVGIDLEDSYYVAVFNQINKNKHFLKKEQLEFNEQLIGTLSSYFTKQTTRFLIGQRLDNIVILIQDKSFKEKGTDVHRFFEGILEYCQKLYRTKKFKIGISLRSESIETTDQQYEEALAAFQMANQQRRLISYDSLGAVGILIQVGNESVIKKFVDNLLGQLMSYDKKKGTEFIKTLYVYLSNGGNLELTACTMALSISGLRYRIQKIDTLLGSDIRNPHVNYQLYLAIQLLIVTGELDIEL